jgi:hypothetical protein
LSSAFDEITILGEIVKLLSPKLMVSRTAEKPLAGENIPASGSWRPTERQLRMVRSGELLPIGGSHTHGERAGARSQQPASPAALGTAVQ